MPDQRERARGSGSRIALRGERGSSPAVTVLGALGALLGALAAIATILTFVFDLDVLRLPGGDGSPSLLPCRDPDLSLSTGSGPSGTQVVVTGRGFPSDEDVTLSFHVERLTPSRTDAEGGFSVTVTIPGTLDAFAPMQFDLQATTLPTVCSDRVAFQLTS